MKERNTLIDASVIAALVSGIFMLANTFLSKDFDHSKTKPAEDMPIQTKTVAVTEARTTPESTEQPAAKITSIKTLAPTPFASMVSPISEKTNSKNAMEASSQAEETSTPCGRAEALLGLYQGSAYNKTANQSGKIALQIDSVDADTCQSTLKFDSSEGLNGAGALLGEVDNTGKGRYKGYLYLSNIGYNMPVGTVELNIAKKGDHLAAQYRILPLNGNLSVAQFGVMNLERLSRLAAY
jgi:hypothetical protein